MNAQDREQVVRALRDIAMQLEGNWKIELPMITVIEKALVDGRWDELRRANEGEDIRYCGDCEALMERVGIAARFPEVEETVTIERTVCVNTDCPVYYARGSQG